MAFNLKKIAQAPDINDQASLDSYIQMLISQLNRAGTMPTEDALAGIADMNSLAQYGIENFTQLKDMIQQQMDMMEQQQDMQNQMVTPEQEPGTPVVINPPTLGSKNPFNLKKAQEAEVPWDSMGLNDSSEIEGDRLEEINNIDTKKYETHNDLNEMLRGIVNNPNGFYIAWNEILSENPKYPDSAQSALKDYLRNFESKAEEQILDEADIIHKYIYGKENTMKYKAPYKEVSSSVDEISNIIKKIAQETVEQEERKPFNIKTAQHKTETDAIMYGPGQTRIDPFYRKPVSDWHIVERNKGFGLVVDDIWNIDYEAIWRGNIMDKYSRPYRDTNTGEWVGGYIQKRFEVDKNIPETSNIQLKPGQKRRPILPQYGNTESRLQEARSNGKIEGAIDTSKPFNWKEASKKKS